MASHMDKSWLFQCVTFATILTTLCTGKRLIKEDSPKSTATCIYDDKIYPAGERFHPDLCTNCHCPSSGGRANCAVEDCKYDPTCVKYVKTEQSICCDICVEHGCQDQDGAIFRPGEVVSVTSCTTCICPPGGGRIECSHVKCPNATCVDALLQPGDCCLTCPNGPNCWLGKEILPVGVVVKRKKCKTCQCPDTEEPLWLYRKGAHAVCTISYC